MPWLQDAIPGDPQELGKDVQFRFSDSLHVAPVSMPIAALIYFAYAFGLTFGKRYLWSFRKDIRAHPHHLFFHLLASYRAMTAENRTTR